MVTALEAAKAVERKLDTASLTQQKTTVSALIGTISGYVADMAEAKRIAQSVGKLDNERQKIKTNIREAENKAKKVVDTVEANQAQENLDNLNDELREKEAELATAKQVETKLGTLRSNMGSLQAEIEQLLAEVRKARQ